MPPLFRMAPLRHDVILILIGAFLTYLFATVAPLASQSIIKSTEFYKPVDLELTVNKYSLHNNQDIGGLLVSVPPDLSVEPEEQNTTFRSKDLVTLPETTIVEHAPGWTLFRDIYMTNENTAESKALREPTPWNMDNISPEEARQRWGSFPSTRRVWSVEGNTFLLNDPPQFLMHYYHFCAELLFGAWSLWAGAAYPEPPPPIHRIIFPRSSSAGWRDKPGFNGYFLRAAFPSLTVEVDADWNDRVTATSTSIDSGRAWHFPYLLLADRSAAFRGKFCGSQNQRTASESVDTLIDRSKLDKHGLWWRSIRYAVWRFAGATVDDEGNTYENNTALDDRLLSSPVFEETEKIVITYISRQSSRRSLNPEDHQVLVNSLEDLVRRKNADVNSMVHADGFTGKEWELNVVKAKELSKDDQIRLAARSTFLLGVHGNGLSHLILMPRTKVSTVIEIFYPGGFAHDYEWTTRTLGMAYFGVWNDTYFTGETTPQVRYPKEFHSKRIPVYGPRIASIIEERVAGEL